MCECVLMFVAWGITAEQSSVAWLFSTNSLLLFNIMPWDPG